MSEAFRPSNIHRYIHCNLWRFLPKEEKTPEKNAYLAERTKDHERLEQEQFTEKESECSAYFFVIKERADYLFKEQRLSMEIGDKILQGTPDVYAYDVERKSIHILDYKTGRMYVTAENNSQLLAYAMLVTDNHPDWEVEKIELAILNTQHDSVDRHIFTGRAPILDLKSRIEKAIRANETGASFGKPGKWCQFCPSKRYCIRQRNYHELKNYADMDTDELILTTKRRFREIDRREKEVKAGVHSELLSPLVSERTRRYWKDNLPEKFFTMKPITVSEAEEKFSNEEIAPYINQKLFKVFQNCG